MSFLKKLKKIISAILIVLILSGIAYTTYYIIKEQNITNTTYTVTFDANGASLENESITTNKDTSISLPNPSKTGYIFLGWYYNDIKWDNTKPIKANITLKAKWKPIKYNITFIVNGIEKIIQTDYDTIPKYSGIIRKLAEDKSKEYKFHGWNPEPEKAKSNATYEAIFTDEQIPAHYYVTINKTFNEAGTVTGNGCYEYGTSATLTTTLQDAFEFLGWFIDDNLLSSDLQVTIPSIEKDLKIVAKYKYKNTQKITLCVDNEILNDDSIITYPTNKINKPNIDASKYHKTGYKINAWYIDKNLKTPYIFDKMPFNDITLYAKWDYSLGEGFYNYQNEFSNYKNKAIEIDSYEKLVYLIEYITFYNILDRINVNINISTYLTNLELIEKAFNQIKFPFTSSISYSNNSIQIQKSNINSECTKTADINKLDTYKQQPYAFAQTPKTNKLRNDFYIDSVSKTLNVETSNQLVYALEKGLRPIPKPNSSAEKIYSNAKEVLSSISSNDLSDIDKTKAIYEWLILNVDYDQKAFGLYSNSQEAFNWWEYDSWFAEGVFNNKVAVCDGIAKAFLILAKIENIPTIRCAGNNHAWNKVFVNNNWYGIDATHGDINIQNQKTSYLTYTTFLFDDNFRKDKFNDVIYPEIKTSDSKSYNYFDEYTNTYNNSPFDLIIDNKEELNNLLNYINNIHEIKKINTISFEIILSKNFKTNEGIKNYSDYQQKISNNYIKESNLSKKIKSFAFFKDALNYCNDYKVYYNIFYFK